MVCYLKPVFLIFCFAVNSIKFHPSEQLALTGMFVFPFLNEIISNLKTAVNLYSFVSTIRIIHSTYES